ncbi:MAG: ABC transporter ATP-binding protein [Actinomycetota bacterium]
MRVAQSTPEEQTSPHLEGAWAVLRRGLQHSPELRSGALYTAGMALVSAVGSLLLPILIQQILDNGVVGRDQVRLRFVFAACGLAAVAIGVIYVGARLAYRRLVRAAERSLRNLRVRTFEHIHALSIAEQTAERRGVFVSRVTADVDILAQFMQWAGISWITSSVLLVGVVVLMFVYSWQLTLVTLLAVAPITLVLRLLQRKLLESYDNVRTRVGETLTEISESVMGADVVRAYGLDERMDRKLKGAIERQYRAYTRAMKFQSLTFPTGQLFGGVAAGAVLATGVFFGDGWGVSAGRVIAFMFLVNLLLQPLAEMAEIFDMTQTAIAGWRKILSVMDIPLDVVEPEDGAVLPDGDLSIEARDVAFSYSDGQQVLHAISLEIEAGAHVAIVGETGCGKTTFAKLLTRLADPTAGVIRIGGVDLRDVDPGSRRRAIRMVPQDGFLFEGTIADNVAYGREGAGDRDVEAAFAALGLSEWVSTMPEGLSTPVGQRGENLSAGEQQLVALVRAQIAQPSVLILDEATSAVDPETERAIAEALEHLSEGRTTVTIAHRLSTAEAADEVFVFDRGRLVERGDHASLVEAGGVYAGLYESWLGNTRAWEAAG